MNEGFTHFCEFAGFEWYFPIESVCMYLLTGILMYWDSQVLGCHETEPFNGKNCDLLIDRSVLVIFSHP
jgi:hypothetical protein